METPKKPEYFFAFTRMSLMEDKYRKYQRRFTTTFWGIDNPQMMKDIGYCVSEEQGGATRLMLGGIGDAPTQETLTGVASYLSREALVVTKGNHCSEPGSVCKARFTGTCTQVFCCCRVIADALMSVQKKLFYNNARLTLNQQRDATKQGAEELSLTALHGSKPLSSCSIGAENLFPSIRQLQFVTDNLQFTLDSFRLFLVSTEAALHDQEINVYGISNVDALISTNVHSLAIDLYHNTTEGTIKAYTNALIEAAKLLETMFQYAKLVISPYRFIWNGVAIVATQDPWSDTRKRLINLIDRVLTGSFNGRIVRYDTQHMLNAHGSLDNVLHNIYTAKTLSLYEVEMGLLDNDLGECQVDTSSVECLAVLNAITDQDQRDIESMDELVADLWEYCESLTAKEAINSIAFSGEPSPLTGFLNEESGAWVSFSGLELEIGSCPWKGMLIIQAKPEHLQAIQEGLNRASYKDRTLYAVRIMCPPELVERPLPIETDDEGSSI